MEEPSVYQVKSGETYRLIRAIVREESIHPIEAFKPCNAIWRCKSNDEKCFSFRGYDPNTRLVACVARELADEPIDRKRFFILSTMIGQVQHDLITVLLDMDERNLNAIISGQHNIRAKIVLEPNVEGK
jgi:hypothetical protein